MMTQEQQAVYAKLFIITRDERANKRNTPFPHRIYCILCDTELDCVQLGKLNKQELAEQKYGSALSRIEAITFETKGNFGSQVLDGDGSLFFSICDRCIVSKSDKMYYLPNHPYKRHKWYKFSDILFSFWQPKESVIPKPTSLFSLLVTKVKFFELVK